MKGKIDKEGFLLKEVPGEGFIKCLCVNDACFPQRDYNCFHACVAFEGPLPVLECIENPASSRCPKNCNSCQYLLPTGRTIIKIYQGRELVFEAFEDERVPK